MYVLPALAARLIEARRTGATTVRTGNLDPVTSWEIIQLLIQINQLGTTVLMATPWVGPQLDEVIRFERKRFAAGWRSPTAAMGLFHFAREDRKREGGFWRDFLNIQRTTSIKGWWFETLVVVSGDAVLFRNIAGQPNVDRVERQTNPLGPLQPAGEGAGALLLH